MLIHRMDLSHMGPVMAGRFIPRPRRQLPGDLRFPSVAPPYIVTEGEREGTTVIPHAPQSVTLIIDTTSTNGRPGRAWPIGDEDPTTDPVPYFLVECYRAGLANGFRVRPKLGKAGTYAEVYSERDVMTELNRLFRIAEDPDYYGADPARWPAWVRR